MTYVKVDVNSKSAQKDTPKSVDTEVVAEGKKNVLISMTPLHQMRN